MSKHQHRRKGRPPEDFSRITPEAEKRVRKQDRRHKCHERCEHAHEAAGNAVRGCGGCLPLILSVLLALGLIALVITGKF